MVSQLTREVAFYRNYHRNPVNVGLHIAGIPTILFTTFYCFSAVRYRSSNYLTLGVALSLVYLLKYIMLDRKFGTFLGLSFVGIALSFGKWSVSNPHYYLSGSLWIAGWIAQFIGHGFFEGRAPALFDNLQQALLLAPYFAALEIAAILGYDHAKAEMAKVDEISMD